MDSNIKVLIVDDHKLISEAWSSLLKDAPNILVVGTADNEDDAYTMSMQHKPDIVLMDINLGEGSGFNATEKIKSALEAEVCKNGAWIEDKGQALTFHFRNVEPENRPPIEAKAKELIIDAGFKVGLAHCAIECKPKVLESVYCKKQEKSS